MFHSIRAYPAFRFLWTSNLLFFTASWTQTLVLGWLAYELTRSEFLLALYTAARFAPMAFGPLGGVIADRVDRASFLMWTQVLALLVAATMAATVLFGVVQYWHILAAGFMTGLAQAPVQPTRYTLAFDIVARGDVANATALNSLALMGTQVFGPSLGGVLIVTVGAAGALALAAASFLLSVIALHPIRRHLEPRIPSAKRTSVGAELLDVVGIIKGRPDMLAILSVTIAANVFVWPVFQGLMPVFAGDVLSVGADGLGGLFTATGIGAIVGSLVIASLGDFSRKGLVFLATSALLGMAFVGFAMSRSLLPAVAFMAVYGVASAGFGVLQSALLLSVSPPEARGRIMGVQMLAIGVLPLAMIVHGIAGSVVGVATSTAIAGVGLVLTIAAIAVAAPGLRNMS